ncbi:MAG: hypothetical protein J0H49_35785 [Acidobacteria bacterium]|nr:hypothetical protein [Acidobacteriota bacterium]
MRGNKARHRSITVTVTALLLLFVLPTLAQSTRTGELNVHTHCSVDLDAGKTECIVTLDGDDTELPGHPIGKHDDFRLEPAGNRLYLVPRNGALLSKTSSRQAGKSGCEQALYAKNRVRIDGLTKGSYLCVRTNKAGYAELLIEEPIRPGATHVRFGFSSWDR